MTSQSLKLFVSSVKPAAQRSKLAVHLPELAELRRLGYSIRQACKYLATVGVTASPSNVWAYLKRHLEPTGPAQRAKQSAPATAHTPPVPVVPPAAAISKVEPSKTALIDQKSQAAQELVPLAARAQPTASPSGVAVFQGTGPLVTKGGKSFRLITEADLNKIEEDLANKERLERVRRLEGRNLTPASKDSATINL